MMYEFDIIKNKKRVSGLILENFTVIHERLGVFNQGTSVCVSIRGRGEEVYSCPGDTDGS